MAGGRGGDERKGGRAVSEKKMRELESGVITRMRRENKDIRRGEDEQNERTNVGRERRCENRRI